VAHRGFDGNEIFLVVRRGQPRFRGREHSRLTGTGIAL
jgi:hypothetical protein